MWWWDFIKLIVILLLICKFVLFKCWGWWRLLIFWLNWLRNWWFWFIMKLISLGLLRFWWFVNCWWLDKFRWLLLLIWLSWLKNMFFWWWLKINFLKLFWWFKMLILVIFFWFGVMRLFFCMGKIILLRVWWGWIFVCWYGYFCSLIWNKLRFYMKKWLRFWICLRMIFWLMFMLGLGWLVCF